MYTCSQRPKHLSVGIDKFEYRLPYSYLVGGVFAIKPDQYRLANGYSNSYWGWGGEGNKQYKDFYITFKLEFEQYFFLFFFIFCGLKTTISQLDLKMQTL